MTTLASPSPTLSPAPSFHGANSHAAFVPLKRHSSASHLPSSSSSKPHAIVGNLSGRRSNGPAQSMEQSAVKATSPVAAVEPTTDAATQYTPPGYPPTARWPVPPTHIDNITRSTKEITFTAPNPMQAPHSTTTPSKRREPEPEPEHDHDASTTTSAATTTTTTTTTDAPVHPAEANPRRDPSPHLSLVPSASTIASASRGSSDSSPSKRAKANGTKKVLPNNYADCDVTDLGILISDMLMELVRINDNIPLRDGQLTRFHSRAPPGISVRDYLNRLIVHATLSPPVLLSMVYYIDRMCSLYPGFTISSLTVHRFLIAAATVAAKGLSDSFWTNNMYARVGGVSAKELALLELFFLEKLEWRIVPQPEVLVEYYQMLVERSEGYTFAST